MTVMSKGAKLADIIASVHITLDALAQAQSSNARPGMHNTRETRGRLQRKEVRKAYCNLLDVEQELFTLKRQIENEEDVVLPRNVRDGDAHFRGINRHMKLSHDLNEDGFFIGDEVVIEHPADSHGNNGRSGAVVGTTPQFLYIVLSPLVGVPQNTVKKMSKFCVHVIDGEELSLDSFFSAEDDVDDDE